MKKKIKIFLSVVVALLVVSVPVTYKILVKKNKYVREWHELPKEEKRLGVCLSFERIANNIVKPNVSQEIPESITVEKIEESVIIGADWILSVQEPSGRFRYWYNPEKKKFSAEHDDNFLRQAGTGYSLMLVYEVTGNKNYLEAAKRNLHYLLKYKQEVDSTKACFLYKRKAKLGGIALPMLTMLKIKSLDHDPEYDEVLKKLADMMIHLQDLYGTGQFKSTYVYQDNYEYEKNSGWESKIYPGEALLALVFMYKEFGDEKYKESIDCAFKYYESHGWGRKASFIPWASSAFCELYTITGDEKYSDFVFKMCDFTLRRQNLNSKRQVYGSFDPLPTVFTSTSFEGIGDALMVCKLLGDEKKYEQYKSRSIIAYKWLMGLQYTGEDSLAYGGFKKCLYDQEIRIDNTQHSISALSKGLKYIFYLNQ